MVPDTAKISIAMELIESKIAECAIRKRKKKDEKIEKEYKELIFAKEEIYKGNYEVINEIIKEAGDKK